MSYYIGGLHYTYLTSNGLKITYGNAGSKKFALLYSMGLTAGAGSGISNGLTMGSLAHGIKGCTWDPCEHKHV